MSEKKLTDNAVSLKREDFDHICRCCLSRNPMANIFQLKFHETFLVDIFKLFNTQVNWEDDLPKAICASCTATVIHFYNFKKMYDKSVVTLQNIARESKEIVKKKGLLLISYEHLNILPPLGENVEKEKINLEENKINIKEELCEESQQESKDQENINNIDNNASTILKETPKSDQTKISPRKDKHKFTLPYFCKTCNKWITATGRHKHSTPRKGSHVCEICGKSYLQKAALNIHYRIHKLMLLAKGEHDENGASDDTTKQKKKYNYQCSCDETFTSSQDLIQHKKEKNHQDPLYRNCEICNKTVSYRGYKNHKSNHFAPSPKKSFACEYCGLTFTFNNNLKRHIKLHTGEKPHVCDFCGKGFIQKKSLEDHRRGMHTGEKPFICDFCGISFGKKTALMNHRRLHTGEKPYLCDHCGVAFRTSLGYKNHLKGKHQEEFKCDICNKSYSSKKALEQHMIRHGNKMELQCEICNKSYSSEKVLKEHMIRHGDKIQLQCEICNKSCFSKKLLKQHMIRHGEKKYICTHCTKDFYTKHELDSHLLTHTGGEKKFICHLCGKGFEKMPNLKLHELIHTGQRPYSCKICFKTFRQSAHLVSHMRIHSGEKPYACPYCDKSFAHITTRVVHVRSHTGERPYVCDVCFKGFHHSSSMTKHRQSHFKNHLGTKLQEST